jgi:hypothetical protein
LPAKLATTIKNIDVKIENETNRQLITEFYHYLIEIETSESYQNGLIKVLIRFAEYIGEKSTFYHVKDKEKILEFLNLKRKNETDDPDKKWITTWNDYLWRIKYFYRWLANTKEKTIVAHKSDNNWETPSFVNIKMKKTKRLSPYSETDIWDKEELFTIIKYEPHKRNKAAVALLWDLDARPHEVTLLKIKHIRLKEKYGEGEIPHQAKTGSGPLLLTFSFPYIRDWLNEHPFKNEPEARLICNLMTGAPIKSDQINEMMKQLRKRIIRLLENNKITDVKEAEKLDHLLKAKKWNPYCIRHSAITADSDYLPEYALKKKVRWSMNSKQGARYIKRRMGNELRNKILEHNGIISEETQKKRPLVPVCPRCDLTNVLENKYCSNCSYPLTSEAYSELKQDEEKRFKELEEKYSNLFDLTQNMETKFQQILLTMETDRLY